VLASRGWQKGALALNLLGSALPFVLFQATSSDVKIVATIDHRTALCVAGRAMIVTSPGGSGVSIGMPACPDWENARPAAVINVEYPFFVTLGFLMLISGFVIQYFAVPDPHTIDRLRSEPKAWRKTRKQR